ncbi:MAG TPA: nicotinate-nucleotide--dimethylbenzimidazole phosphoribosyltransferase, partial [Acidimicrobiales bacterium]|nr:nicotinate-nucleotide--dimethylbenzimidazole phosphoribosyltransferase [Acidimicrobiales bacterium]
MPSTFALAAAAVRPLDRAAEADAAALQARLTKPRGALGRVEDIGVRLAAISGRCPPPVPRPAAVAVFAADHGVVDEGVTAWPREVTAQMVANFARGGAAINVLARQAGASVTVIDVGVATELPPGCKVVRRVVRAGGTANLAREPAMAVAECEAALDVGAGVAAELAAGGARALVTGDMGIGNTT